MYERGGVYLDLLGVLFPRTCPMCRRIITGAYICENCRTKLPYITGPRCCKCSKPVLKEEGEYCTDCGKGRHKYKKGLAAFLHTGELKQAVYSMKYDNKLEYGDFFAEETVKRHRREILSWGCDCIIPVPLFKKKKIKRGFNQAEVIAAKLSRRLQIPYNAKILYRVKDTEPMKQLDHIHRKKNLEKAFKISENIVKLNKVLLVDDIYTTGSTIDECSTVLLAAGAEEIYFICLSIGVGC